MKNLVLTTATVLMTVMAYAFPTSDLTVKVAHSGLYTVVVDGQKQVRNSNTFPFMKMLPGTYPVQILKENYWGSPAVLFSGHVRVPHNSTVLAKLDHRNNMHISVKQLGGYGQTSYHHATHHGVGNEHAGGFVSLTGGGAHCAPEPAPVLIGMRPSAFQNVLAGMANQSFDNDKLRIAKQAIRHHGASSQQVLEMMNMLTFESRKLNLAKFAHPFVHDPENFFIVNDGFTFSSSVRELDRFLYG